MLLVWCGTLSIAPDFFIPPTHHFSHTPCESPGKSHSHESLARDGIKQLPYQVSYCIDIISRGLGHGRKTVMTEGKTKSRTIYMEYLSEEGYNKIVAELRQLETVELPRVREAIAEAREQGDLSENFEYHAAKREQGRILGRIRYRQRILENARVIDRALLHDDTVGLLTRVEMTNLDTGTRMAYTIVSSHEADLREGKLSILSPIARALAGKKAGETVSVKVPAGTLRLHIDSVTLG